MKAVNFYIHIEHFISKENTVSVYLSKIDQSYLLPTMQIRSLRLGSLVANQYCIIKHTQNWSNKVYEIYVAS